MNKKVIALAVIFFFSLAFAGYQWYVNNSYLNDYRCRGSITIFNYDLSTQINARFHFAGKTGRVIYYGSIFKKNELIGFINKDISFDIANDDGSISMHSRTVTPLVKDTASQTLTSQILPEFFLMKDKTQVYEIKKNANGLLFIRDSLPAFYCEKD
ncbi:TPA: hypothetical protein RCG91_004271 [Enterobacter roggenkampii]|nr:hypothetical protein [Enterobacter roggenkampii]